MSKARPPLVVHIIYALSTGGLENGLVHLINGSPPGRYRHAIICLTRADAFAQRIAAPDVEVYELEMQPGRDWAAYRRLWQLLRKLRPAIVHSRNMAALEAQLVTLFVPGLRRVHGEHGRDVGDLGSGNSKYRLLRKLMRFVVHRYTAVSRDLEHWLVNSIGVPAARVHQIYNGVDQTRFHPPAASEPGHDPGSPSGDLLPDGFVPASGALLVGTVGRLAQVKNQGALLEAAAKMLDIRPDLRERLRLVIIGEGAMREPLSAEAERLNVQQIVWMPGDRSDIPELLRALDVFVLPSLSEGISNTLLEAMASGLPVIATRVGGNPELVRDNDNGLLVPVTDSDALCEALLQLLDSPQQRQRMGNSGAEFVHSHFSWPQTIARYMQVYDEVLGAQASLAAPRSKIIEK